MRAPWRSLLITLRITFARILTKLPIFGVNAGKCAEFSGMRQLSTVFAPAAAGRSVLMVLCRFAKLGKRSAFRVWLPADPFGHVLFVTRKLWLCAGWKSG